MKWTEVIISQLPATTKELNAHPMIARMNATHQRARIAKELWAKPINSMVYGTLYRLRRQGAVVRDEKGVYHLTDELR